MKTSKRRRRYSLFEKVDGKWVRRSDYAYFKDSAIQIYQSTLLSTYFEGKEYALRPVPTCVECGQEAKGTPARKVCFECEDNIIKRMADTRREVHDA